MNDVYYEQRDDAALLHSDTEGEWLASNAIVELDAWV